MMYILDQKKTNGSHDASGKAMLDVFAVMKSCGVKTVFGIDKNKSKLLRVLDFPILVLYCIFVFGRGDKCIYVFSENSLKIKIINAFRKIKGYKTVCFINDIVASRTCNIYDEANWEKVKPEMDLVGAADVILAPNEGSIKYMKEHGIKSEMIPVKVWDYLMDTNPAKEHVLPKKVWKIAFVGNLGKSVFLRDLNRAEVDFDNVEFHLWGGGCDTSMWDGYKHVVYEGSVAPDELPAKIASCDIGLVWDGDTIFTLDGIIGNYLSFCNSHKFGCYLGSGLPVAVCSKSGGAYFVRESGCGVCIDSLEELGGALASIESEGYSRMLENVKAVSEKIRRGGFIKDALEKL